MQKQKVQLLELIQLNEALENYFANTIIPQLFVDAQLILRKFTPPAMKQFKLHEDFIGKSFEEIKENFRYPTIIENIKTVISTGKLLEKEIQTTNFRWYQMNILPYLVREENKTNGVIITFVDITHRIRDLKDQERMIAEQQLLLDTIAHDIKNPIHALGLTVQLMKKLPEDNMKDFPLFMDSLEASLIDLKKVIESLVNAHLQRQKYQTEEELLDFENILEDVRLTLASQIYETGTQIKFDLKVSELTFVRRKLRSLMFNLISNAIKYTPADRTPSIEISTYVEGEFLVITVADNGMGLSEQDQEHIFEKFFRVHTTPEGSGVGLYLVHTITTSAKGKIEIESESGKGSVFKIYLPHKRIKLV